MRVFAAWVTPFLCGLFPVLSLYSHNVDQVVPAEALMPVLTAWGIVLALFLLVRKLMGDEAKASLLTSVFVLLFFGHGYLSRGLRMLGVGSELLVLLLWLAGWAGFVIFLARSKRDWTKEVALFHVMGWGLVVFSLVPILMHWGNMALMPKISSLAEVQPLEIKADGKHHEKPDIYFLIFDRYPNSRVLQKTFGYDNQPFLSGLERKGFYVAHQSRANYTSTTHSLLSSLNLQHINTLSKNLPKDVRCDGNLLYGMMGDHLAGRFLKNQGYRFIHMGSWWRPTGKNPYADESYNLFTTSEFSKIIFDDTPLPLVGEAFSSVSPLHACRKGNIATFKKLQEISEKPGPKFVFVHFLMPHPPYIFDESGGFVSREKSSTGDRKTNFIGQLRYTNTKIEEAVSHILKVSKKPPVIIVQADEGPYPDRFEDGTGIERVANWRESTDAEIWTKNGILNAMYLPGFDRQKFSQDMTSVNTFRLLFNHYFGTTLAPFPDKTYTYLDLNHMCDFEEVTSRINRFEKRFEKGDKP